MWCYLRDSALYLRPCHAFCLYMLPGHPSPCLSVLRNDLCIPSSATHRPLIYSNRGPQWLAPPPFQWSNCFPWSITTVNSPTPLQWNIVSLPWSCKLDWICRSEPEQSREASELGLTKTIFFLSLLPRYILFNWMLKCILGITEASRVSFLIQNVACNGLCTADGKIIELSLFFLFEF